jgi:UDP-N-acetyl-2-amino-2-deoxyglucuronate dehydrogenase
MNQKRYALIGAAGFIARRHFQAIKETGGELIAAMDPHDSVGILDSFFPDADFFTEFELFDRHLERLKREGRGIDYLVVCSPNYLHDAHCRFGLRLGADVICEKPVVLAPWNIQALMEIEKETIRRVNVILQLRLHPDVKALMDIATGSHLVDLKYVTPRGSWYHSSWKGDLAKSGGIITNIGIHLFDMLLHVFGPCSFGQLTRNDECQASGILELQKAKVIWDLSITGKPNRSLFVDRQPFDFTQGFTELHTKSYQEILDGRGFTLQDAAPAIELVHQLRNYKVRD